MIPNFADWKKGVAVTSYTRARLLVVAHNFCYYISQKTDTNGSPRCDSFFADRRPFIFPLVGLKPFLDDCKI